MPSTKTNNLKTMRVLQDIISPDVRGIIWVTETPLKERPYPFGLLDYFFSGVISQSINQKELPGRKKNLFFSNSFGRPFFLVQIAQELCDKKKNTKEVFEIIQKIHLMDDKVLIIEENRGQTSDILSGMYPNFSFTSLHLGEL